jgi:hypothetical protein
MRKSLWVVPLLFAAPATLAVLLLFAAASFAGDIPPDGNTSVRGGGGATPITAQNQSIAFAGWVPDVPGCTATFSGVNATGTPWNFLALTLEWSPKDVSDGGFSIGSNGGSLFLATGGACGSTIPDTITSSTVDFLQAGGTGIGNSGAFTITLTDWQDTPLMATIAYTTPATTPEPSSLLVFGTSLLGLVPFRRKLFGR